jgi:hypothetical protein
MRRMSTRMWRTISEFYLWTLILFALNNCVQLQKPNSGENPTFFNIGGVLSNAQSEKNFSETIAVSMVNPARLPGPFVVLCQICLIMQRFIIIATLGISLFAVCAASSLAIEYSLNWK